MTKELRYIFARIEDEKLVEDPDKIVLEYGGPGDSLESFLAPIRKEYPKFYRERVPLVCSSRM